MPQTLRLIILLLVFSLPVAAQETEDGPDAAEVTDAAAEREALPPGADEDADEAPEDEEVDDSDLDLQTYEEDDDVFVPTEEIPADEPIPFPSNI